MFGIRKCAFLYRESALLRTFILFESATLRTFIVLFESALLRTFETQAKLPAAVLFGVQNGQNHPLVWDTLYVDVVLGN